jgi:mannose-1-phosphate guanylyltransferase
MANIPKEVLAHTYVMILCGGGGTRLWPRSRKRTPKQFIHFFFEKTLYQQAIARAKLVVPTKRIMIITNHDYVDDVHKESPEIPRENIIAEPQKRNTALAMGVAAAYVYKRDPQAVVVNFASDHIVEDLSQATKTVLISARIAFEEKVLISVGITPTFAHTGYGYIKAGKELKKLGGLPVYQVTEFKEKPDLATAQRFVESGKYFWNANWYTWSAEAILAAFKQHAPDLYQNIDRIYRSIGTSQEKSVIEKEYEAAQEEAIDTAISEKARNLVVVPGNFGWNDIGSWNVVWDLAKKDENRNVVIQSSKAGKKREILIHDSHDCLVHYQDQLIALVGVENLVVIDTNDAILVCRKDRAQEVKKIVDQLKERRETEYL